MGKILFILVLSLMAGQVSALELKSGTKTIYIQEKKDWQLGKDLFGMPFIYFSPMENGQRSNISFTDTGAEVELDIKSLAANQLDYQNDKKEWASEVGATPLGFLPYEVSVNQHGHRIHRIGFRYQHEEDTYIEKSFYVECRGKILFSKSLRLTQNEAHEEDFAELLNSLDCGGV